MNNEPVAWMVENDEDVSFIMCGKGFAKPDESWNKVTSVYTHPIKELTDEEIRHIQAICHLKDVGYDNFIMRFARAILRKAQEK
jgi:hypothetical protein